MLMLVALLSLAALACSSCKTTPSTSAATRGYIERQRVILNAERRLAERNLPLPHAYESEVIEEAMPPRTSFVVTFRRRGRDQSRIYSVDISKETGHVEGIIDYRASVDGISR